MSRLTKEFQKNYADRASREDIDRVFELINSDRHIESVTLVKELLENYPNDIILYTNAATTLTILGQRAQEVDNLEAAEEYWDAALDYGLAGLKTNPSDVRLLCQVGKNLRQIGDFENAEAFYLRALRINDEDKYTWTSLADMYVRWTKETDALDDETKAEALQDAANCYAKAYTLDPNDQVTLRKMYELSDKGYRAEQEGFDLEDPALDMINDSEMVKPANLPIPNIRRTLDMP